MKAKINIFDEESEKVLKNTKDWIKSINWGPTLITIFLHIGSIIGLYYLLLGKSKFYTYLWVYHMFILGGIGLGPGVHRYFCHKSYKTKRGLHIFLIFCQTLAGQYSIVSWTKIHRAHHKYIDSDGDPSNIKRGFLFSHFYWSFKYTPECKRAIETAYVKDLEEDKDIMFQYKHYIPITFVTCVVFPTAIPYLLWNETLWISFWTNIWRWCLNWNQMGCANSLMHMVGRKPYNKNISAVDSIVSVLFTFGEGYHNYHHVFPWDYKAAEFGDFLHFNISTMLLDSFAKFGWVYDRKVVTQKMIDRRKAKTGDGTHWLLSDEALKNPVWGYGDVDMDIEDKMELIGRDENNNCDFEKLK